MALFKSLTFGNVNSMDYGVYITGTGVYNAPERAVEMFAIPGRNGALAIDGGRYENIEVTYTCGCFANTDAEFSEKIRAFRNAICSQYTYTRLTDEYNPDEYRMALYRSGLEMEPFMSKAGEFEITFDCKPQRFLTSGESTYQIGEWGQTITETGDIVTYQGDDLTAVKSLTTDMEPIQDLHGYDSPWPAGGGKNLFSKDPLVRWITKSVPSGGKIYAQWFDGGGDFQLYAHDANNTEYSLGYITRNKKAFTTPADIVSFGVSASAIHTLGSGNLMISLSDFSGWEPYENICPISGRTGQTVTVTGKNLFDQEDVSRSSAGYCFRQNDVTLKAGTYTFSFDYGGSESKASQLTLNDKNGVRIIAPLLTVSHGRNSLTFTIDRTAGRIWYYTNALGDYSNFMIERSSAATAYEPYTVTTYTRSFVDGQGNELTVYGGEDEIVGGVLTVTHKSVDLGDITWNRNATYNIYYGHVSGKAIGMINYITSAYTVVDKTYTLLRHGETSGTKSTDEINIKDDRYTSVSDFTAGVSGQTVVCELATPQTYQLSANEVETLIGTNHVWSDSGEVTVEYGTDPYTMVNDTPFASKPLIKVTGYGEVGFGDITITITGTAGVVTYIDCDLMECYRMSGGAIVPANQYVTFTGTDFPTIPTGKTRVTSASTISKVEVVPRWWII